MAGLHIILDFVIYHIQNNHRYYLIKNAYASILINRLNLCIQSILHAFPHIVEIKICNWQMKNDDTDESFSYQRQFIISENLKKKYEIYFSLSTALHNTKLFSCTYQKVYSLYPSNIITKDLCYWKVYVNNSWRKFYVIKRIWKFLNLSELFTWFKIYEFILNYFKKEISSLSSEKRKKESYINCQLMAMSFLWVITLGKDPYKPIIQASPQV